MLLQQKESYSPFSDPVLNNRSAEIFDALALLTTLKKKGKEMERCTAM
jgi:hypothetical protein